MREFPRWSNEPPRCRWHGCLLKPHESRLPRFVASIGPLHSGRNAKRIEYSCPVKDCHWCAVGVGECLISKAFRKKEMKLTYLGHA